MNLNTRQQPRLYILPTDRAIPPTQYPNILLISTHISDATDRQTVYAYRECNDNTRQVLPLLEIETDDEQTVLNTVMDKVELLLELQDELQDELQLASNIVPAVGSG